MKYVIFNIHNVLRDCQTSDFRFKTILKDGKVYNLLDGGPRKALEDHCINSKVSHDEGGKSVLRMIVCGGDGSIGWVLSVMDIMKIPLGKHRVYSSYTTNDKIFFRHSNNTFPFLKHFRTSASYRYYSPWHWKWLIKSFEMGW